MRVPRTTAPVRVMARGPSGCCHFIRRGARQRAWAPMHRAILGAPAAPDAHLLSDLGLHQLRRHRSHRRAQRRHLHVGSMASALSPAGRSRHAARWVGLPARAVGLIRPGIALSRLDPRRLPSACSRASHPRRRPPPTTSAGAPPRPTPRWAMPYTAAADQRPSREIAAQRSGRDEHAPHRPTRHLTRRRERRSRLWQSEKRRRNPT
jgi:hypothetical protein